MSFAVSGKNVVSAQPKQTATELEASVEDET